MSFEDYWSFSIFMAFSLTRFENSSGYVTSLIVYIKMESFKDGFNSDLTFILDKCTV